jgi:DNA-binding Lrp family transcriptional regulator|tara:strand:- start:5203 stop:5958 length:756 start_codon:yes stop_codon:yes gene_type:complete
MAHPAVPIAAADPGGLNLQDNAMRLGRWIGNGCDFGGGLEMLEQNSFHGEIFRVWLWLGRFHTTKGRNEFANLPHFVIFRGRKCAQIPFFEEIPLMSDIDAVNAQILELLQGDGRMTNTKLAEHLNMSETPCWRRLKKLEESGIIEGYQANINRRKLGLGVMAFVQLSCSEHDKAATAEFQRIIEDTPNILACHNTTGEDDFLLIVVARDLDDYSAFVDSTLRRLPGVTGIRSNLSLKEMKASRKLPVRSS